MLIKTCPTSFRCQIVHQLPSIHSTILHLYHYHVNTLIVCRSHIPPLTRVGSDGLDSWLRLSMSGYGWFVIRASFNLPMMSAYSSTRLRNEGVYSNTISLCHGFKKGVAFSTYHSNSHKLVIACKHSRVLMMIPFLQNAALCVFPIALHHVIIQFFEIVACLSMRWIRMHWILEIYPMKMISLTLSLHSSIVSMIICSWACCKYFYTIHPCVRCHIDTSERIKNTSTSVSVIVSAGSKIRLVSMDSSCCVKSWLLMPFCAKK